MLQDTSGFLSILCADEIKAILDGGRASVIEAVGNAYKLHAQGKTSLPLVLNCPRSYLSSPGTRQWKWAPAPRCGAG